MDEDILVPIGVFAMVTAIVWLGGQLKQVRLTKQTKPQQDFLYKFNSGQELADFMQTESGQLLLMQFYVNPQVPCARR